MARKSLEQKIKRGLLSVSEASCLLGISEPTVRKCVNLGWIRSVLIGSNRKITYDEILRFKVEGNWKGQSNGQEGSQD